MKLYRNGNYFIEKSYYGTYQVWNMRSVVESFETLELATQFIEDKLN